MSLPLKVLLVEDSLDDAALIVATLEAGGYDVCLHRVENKAGFEAALKEAPWDLILSDYNLPKFSGMEALRLYKQHQLDIPFIVISGAIGEETAVEALKSGAHDYLLKDRLARLVPAVTRELQDAAKRLAFRQAQEAREKLESELAHAKDLAERANQRKSKMLAFVAHELKNPLSAVIMYSDMLEKKLAGPLNEKQTKFVRNILTGSAHIQAIINDILDVTAIEAGKIEIVPDQLPVDAVLEDVKIITLELARKKNITLAFEPDPQVQWVHADFKRLCQILINLLTNAIKYTPEPGQVTLRIFPSPHAPTDTVFEISDTGIGIPQADLPFVFSEFYRVDTPYTTSKEGLGLGLAVTKKLVDLHHGTITVQSQPSQGTCFTVTFPGLPIPACV